jgi:tRNA threonylcarbamoyl adenosine modification protein YeaZ
MPSYIAVQNTYDVFQIALFINDILVGKKREDKHYTSKLFIPILDQLLQEHNIRINDLDFCAVNCGPGPFSTLRSILASVNGIHAASNLPLIGIDGLEATFLEFYDKQYEHTVVLLNAFNNEVYYLIAQEDHILSKGYQKIDALLNSVRNASTSSARTDEESIPYNSNPVRPELVEGNERLIHFIGNGVTLHQNLIKQTLGDNAIIKDPNPSMCSIEMIGKLGLEKWQYDSPNGYLMTSSQKTCGGIVTITLHHIPVVTVQSYDFFAA